MTDRYTKAIEQLGSDKLDVRIGGIYALERVARDSARDHPTVMEVLTAFIREHSREPWPPQDDDGQEAERSIRPDVQAALTVIGRRAAKHDIRFRDIDLTGADLRGAYLTDDADLRGTNLTGADLRSAYLTDADRDILSADLRSVPEFRDAYLRDAERLDAYLLDADYLDADYLDADLTDATWPDDAPVPEGWTRDSSGRLRRAMPALSRHSQPSHAAELARASGSSSSPR